MQKLLIFLLALLALLAPPSAIAQEAKESCTSRTATTLTLLEAKRDIEKLRYSCVTIAGIIDGSSIWADKESLIRPVDYDNDEATPRIQFERGDYPLSKDGPLEGRVTGILDHCGMRSEELGGVRESTDENGEEIIVLTMLTGTCHYTHDAVLQPTGFAFDSLETPERYTAANLPPEQWTLRTASLSQSQTDIVITKATEMISALVNDDEAWYYLMINPPATPPEIGIGKPLPHVDRSAGFGAAKLRVGEQSDDIYFGRIDDWLEARSARFAARKLTPSLSQPPKIFAEHPIYDEDDDQIYVKVCWCRTEDCAEKWPVTWVDADALRSRPYLCLTVEEHRYSDADVRFAVNVPNTRFGLTEPDWAKVEQAAK